MSTEQRASALLSLIASKAIVPGSFEKPTERHVADEEQHANSLMYAARMKYLQQDDHFKPDTLFMTRKQAHKVSQHEVVSALKKIEATAPPRRPVPTDSKTVSGLAVPWKKAMLLPDEREQTWVPKTQAGCHFWQSQQTGECRAKAPPGWEGKPHPHASCQGDDNLDQDDEAIPEAFAFLYDQQN